MPPEPGTSPGSPVDRLSRAGHNLLGEVLGVLADAMDEGGLELVLPAQAKEVKTRAGGRAPQVTGLAVLIEDGKLDPVEGVAEAGRPDDRGNTSGVELELTDRVDQL